MDEIYLSANITKRNKNSRLSNCRHLILWTERTANAQVDNDARLN